MSEYIVPKWNLGHQKQQEVAGEGGNRPSSNVHNQPPAAHVVHPMSNFEVAELTWGNGQLAMHGLTGILPAPAAEKAAAATPPTLERAGETLESIVHQATSRYNHNERTPKPIQESPKQTHGNLITTSGGKRAQNTAENMQISPGGFMKKRLRSSESDQCGSYNYYFSSNRINSIHEDQVGGSAATAEKSACASASAAFGEKKDGTIMTWASFESPPSLKTKTTDDDSACHDGSKHREEEIETRGGETHRSHSARRCRAAIIHNQSERRRRDRINQKMKALQKLVPNACKTDKASMLDEVIEYLKQLKAQVDVMSRNMPQIMMNPLAMMQQQQLQMSLLARMGMGVGLGMGMGVLDINALVRSTSHPLQPPGLVPTPSMASATPAFVPPHFVMPAATASQAKSPAEIATNTTFSVPFSDPYTMFLAQQSMDMDFYKKMAALYQQEGNQATQTASNPSSQANSIQRE